MDEESKRVVVVTDGASESIVDALRRQSIDVVAVREPDELRELEANTPTASEAAELRRGADDFVDRAMRPRARVRSVASLLALIASAGYSPASLAHIGPKRAEKVVAGALLQKHTIDASNARQTKRDAKRRRDALRTLRGRAEPGHPGCSCVGPNPEQGLSRRGHLRTCSAWLGDWSREDQLEELYGDRP